MVDDDMHGAQHKAQPCTLCDRTLLCATSHAWKGSLTSAGTYAPAKLPCSHGCIVGGEKAGCVAFCVLASGVPCGTRDMIKIVAPAMSDFGKGRHFVAPQGIKMSRKPLRRSCRKRMTSPALD